MSHSSESLDELEAQHQEYSLVDAKRGSIVNETRGSPFLVRKPTKKRLPKMNKLQGIGGLTYANHLGQESGDNFHIHTHNSQVISKRLEEGLEETPNISGSGFADRVIESSSRVAVRDFFKEKEYISKKASPYKNSKPMNSGSIELQDANLSDSRSQKSQRSQMSNLNKSDRSKKSARSTICFPLPEIFFHKENKEKEKEESIPSIENRYIQAINDKTVYLEADLNSTKKPPEQRLRGLLKKHAVKGNKGYDFAEITKRIRAQQSNPFAFKMLLRLKNRILKLPSKIYYWRTRTISKPFDPNTSFLSIWNIIMMIFIIYLLVTIPLSLAFDIDDDALLLAIEWIENIFFILDVFLSFHTGYYQDGILITSHQRIARRYIQSWFFIDLLSCFPFELLIQYEILDSTSGISTVFKVLRVLKIIRVTKVFKIGVVGKLTNTVRLSGGLNGIIRLFKLILTISFLAHWVACFWYLIGSYLSDSYNETWVIHYDLEEMSNAQRYVKSLYWATATLLTVGYGDIVSTNTVESIYTILIMLLGCGVTGFSMNKIGEILQQINAEVNYKDKKKSELQAFLDRNQIDAKLQQKANQYLDFKLVHEKIIRESEQSVLKSLSQSIHDQIVRQINGRVMKDSALFQKSFGSKFLNKLAMMLEEHLLGPQEYVFREGDNQDLSVYFIERGRVNTFVEKFKVSLRDQEKGTYIGEYSFFSGNARQYSAKTATFCSIFCLSQKRFLEELETNPAENEMYHMLKDKINTLGDYRCIGLQCQFCQSSEHISRYCPQVHLVLDKQAVIQEDIRKQEVFEAKFKRGDRPRFHALQNVENMQAAMRRLQTGGTRNTRLISFSETEISLSEKKTKKSTLMLFYEDFEEIVDNHLRSGGIQTLENGLTLDKDEEIQHLKTIFKSKKSTMKEPTERFNRSLTIKHKGESVYIPSEAIDMTEKYHRPSPAEEVVIDQIRNYEIYLPHNNARKIIEQLNSQKQNKRASNAGLKSQETTLFKMRLGKIFDKTKKKTIVKQPIASSIISNDPSPKPLPEPRRKSMFYKKTASPKLVRMRSKSLSKEFRPIAIAQENYLENYST